MKILVIVIKMVTEFNNSKFQFRSSKSVLANVVRERLKLKNHEELVVNLLLGICDSSSFYYLN